MDGIVIATMGKDWCLIEFDDGVTGQMWRVKVQGEPGGDEVPFEVGTKVTLTEKKGD